MCCRMNANKNIKSCETFCLCNLGNHIRICKKGIKFSRVFAYRIPMKRILKRKLNHAHRVRKCDFFSYFFIMLRELFYAQSYYRKILCNERTAKQFSMGNCASDAEAVKKSRRKFMIFACASRTKMNCARNLNGVIH